jgi:hypothetical protein
MLTTNLEPRENTYRAAKSKCRQIQRHRSLLNEQCKSSDRHGRKTDSKVSMRSRMDSSMAKIELSMACKKYENGPRDRKLL